MIRLTLLSIFGSYAHAMINKMFTYIGKTRFVPNNSLFVSLFFCQFTIMFLPKFVFVSYQYYQIISDIMRKMGIIHKFQEYFWICYPESIRFFSRLVHQCCSPSQVIYPLHTGRDEVTHRGHQKRYSFSWLIFVRHGFPYFSAKISTTVNTMVQEHQLKK